MSFKKLFASAGYRLVAERTGYRVWKESENLFGAFWSTATVFNVASELIKYGKRPVTNYRLIPTTRERKTYRPRDKSPNGSQPNSFTHYLLFGQ